MSEDQEQQESTLRGRLIVLTEEQIGPLWPVIKYSIVNSFPVHAPANETTLTGMLQALQSGRLECWMVVERGAEDPMKARPIICVVFGINYDAITQTAFLTLYSVFSFIGGHMQEWRTLMRAFKRKCRKEAVDIMIASTENDKILPLAERLGFEAKTTLVWENK